MKKLKKNIVLFVLISLLVLGFAGYFIANKTKEQNTKNSEKKTMALANFSKKDFFLWEEGKKVKPFYVKKIWKEEKWKSCAECHANLSLEQMRGKNIKKAHWHIQSAHGIAEQMACTTCHNQKKVWEFNHNKTTVNANLTVKLCAQCHFQQKKDWELGAHGKRLSGWKQKRAVKSCVACHNPHQPAFKKRWPSIAPNRPKK